MTIHKSILKWTALYALLLAGSAVYSIPFLWMSTTSVKVDRELFTKDLRLLPMAPHPAAKSPYVDAEYYSHVQGPDLAPLAQGFMAMAQASGLSLPRDIDANVAWPQIGRGLYERMSTTLEPNTWKAGPAMVLAAAKSQVDAAAVEDVFDAVHRRLLLGQIRVRSNHLDETELGADIPYERRLENQTPQRATVIPWTDKGTPCASVGYDFAASADRIVLARVFDLPFDAADLHRVQLNLRPDDSWHELWLTIECNGRRYRAVKPVPWPTSPGPPSPGSTPATKTSPRCAPGCCWRKSPPARRTRRPRPIHASSN